MTRGGWHGVVRSFVEELEEKESDGKGGWEIQKWCLQESLIKHDFN